MFTSDDSDTDTGKNASKAGDKNDTGNGAHSKTVGGKYTHLRSIRTNFPLMITDKQELFIEAICDCAKFLIISDQTLTNDTILY